MTLNDLPGEKPKRLMVNDRTYMGIIRAALMERPREMCGLLLDPVGHGERKFVRTRNVAVPAERAFTVDPHELKRIKENPMVNVIGIVHSHPAGEARPSDYDRGSYFENGWWYLVVGMATGVPVVGCFWTQDGDLVPAKLRVL